MNKEDSWLIVGPGRTGSKVIVDVLRSSYRHCNIPFTYITPGNHPAAEPGFILHSHNAEDFQLGYTKCILSTRNRVESALSWCVQPAVGEWHLYPHRHEEKLNRIEPFVLDPELLLREYHSVSFFYDNLRQYIRPGTIQIDYTEFQSDPTVLLVRLGLDVNTPLQYMPVKNPGKYSDWIKNWDEIADLVKDLPTNPL